MADVVVDARRLRSMLQNRHQTVDDLCAAVGEHARTHVIETSRIDFETLQDVARYLKRPWPYLLIDGEERWGSDKYAHRGADFGERDVSVELMEAYEAVETMLAAANEVFGSPPLDLPQVSIESLTMDATVSRVKDLLDIDLDELLRPSDEFAALRLWSRAVQDVGVFVAQRRLNNPPIRALSRAAGHGAVIVLDTADSPGARVFSLLHELGHVLTKDPAICDLDEHVATERACNVFSERIVMPRELLLRANALDGWTGEESDDQRLRDLAKQIGVSQAALIIRLRRLGHLDEGAAGALELRRTQRVAVKKKTRGGNYYSNAVRRVGDAFAQRSIAAVEAGSAAPVDVSTWVGINQSQFDRFAREVLEQGKSPWMSSSAFTARWPSTASIRTSC